MIRNIPTPPLLFKSYYIIRDKLTPIQNIKYLIIESIVLAIIISSSLYYLLLDINLSIILGISIILVSLINYIWVRPQSSDLEESTLNVDFKKFIIISCISISPIILFYFYNSSNIYIAAIVVIAYTFTLYIRSKKYLSERKFYIPKRSNLRHEWYQASVYLEQGLYHLDKNNNLTSFYWFKKANKQYKYISNNDEQESFRYGAKELANAALLFSTLVYVSKLDYKMYYEEASKSIKKSKQHFSTRFCDICEKRKKLDDVKVYILNDDTHVIYCNYCMSKNKHQKEMENKILKKDVKNACSILQISKPLTEKKIKRAHRDKVKKVHPDVGGSDKEFKKVEESKDILLSHVKNK